MYLREKSNGNKLLRKIKKDGTFLTASRVLMENISQSCIPKGVTQITVIMRGFLALSYWHLLTAVIVF